MTKYQGISEEGVFRNQIGGGADFFLPTLQIFVFPAPNYRNVQEWKGLNNFCFFPSFSFFFPLFPFFSLSPPIIQGEGQINTPLRGGINFPLKRKFVKIKPQPWNKVFFSQFNIIYNPISDFLIHPFLPPPYFQNLPII